MRSTLRESAIVHDLAKQICRRLTGRTIAALQELNACMLSGDDSGLVNVWDEICAQIQYEESGTWELAYYFTSPRTALIRT